MPIELTKSKSKNHASGILTDKNKQSFKFAMTGSLDNNFCFKKLNKEQLLNFHRFIDEILSNKMTISQVDKMFLRSRGPVEKREVYGKIRTIQHYGKDMAPFRIHGYFNTESYFVIYQIDPGHKKHK